MTLSTQQAQAALQDIARAQQRTSILRGYERGAPHLILWGLIWMVGYSLTDLQPAHANLIWLVLDSAGVAASFLIGRAAVANYPQARAAYRGRFAALGATILGFMLATYYVMRPTEQAQFGAFPALLVALVYTVIGIWRGTRWAVIGVLLAVLTLAGLALVTTHFMLWMALIGGLTLIGSGLWLRRA